ncbi:uncharacterized protein LOC125476720 isoform X2 [Pyrus x bretschneideri]|uniref:uncharacterized protein LOC125476720 isoform X2 n=1 Tax=Pyrus x bretschneideri TaxID=225117 RepID=UPI00203037B5|nr:uncharacterized protein LOC125476720 isoform X2 [Pyrus x bretschneideri]
MYKDQPKTFLSCTDISPILPKPLIGQVRPSMQGVYYVGDQDDGFTRFEFSTTASGGSGTPSTETSPQSALRPPPTTSNQSPSSQCLHLLQLSVRLVHMNAWTFYILGKQRNDWRRTVRFVVPQRI